MPPRLRNSGAACTNIEALQRRRGPTTRRNERKSASKGPAVPVLGLLSYRGLPRYARVVILSRWRCHPSGAQSARNSRRGLARAAPPPLLPPCPLSIGRFIRLPSLRLSIGAISLARGEGATAHACAPGSVGYF